MIIIAVETTGAINSDGLEFSGDLGRCITKVTDDIRESAFLFQRLSVLIQRYNAVAIYGTFAHTTSEDELYSRSSLFEFSI